MADATVDEVAVYFASTTTVSPDADITLTVNSVTEKGEICSQQNDSLIKLSIRFRIKHCYCICEFCHQINKIRIIFANNQSSKIFIIFFIINNLRKNHVLHKRQTQNGKDDASFSAFHPPFHKYKEEPLHF